MMDISCSIVSNELLAGRTYRMDFLAPEVAPRVKGGQFLMIKAFPTNDPMGRRAFAIGDVRGNVLSIFYDVVGRATKMMSQLKEGDHVKVFGPLGKGLFDTSDQRYLLIGGGIGLSGLTLLGKELKKLKKDVVFVYGGRSKEHLGMRYWLEEEGFKHILYTEDGSLGKRGLVVDVLKDFDNSWTICACGPKAMLRALKELAVGYKVYLSLESRMACGWGVCLGCVVRNKDGHYLRVCYEGPVFRADEVML